MFAHGSVSLQLFPVVWIFLRSLDVICYDRWVLSKNHKNYYKDWCAMNSQFKLNELWPYYQKHLKQIVLNRTNIRGLRSNFVDCESFLKSNSPDILVLCEAHLDDSIDSGNFSVIDYLPLIRKDSSTHMHGLAVYVKEGLPFRTGLISRKLCRFLLMFSSGFTSLSILILFPLSITFFVLVHGF